MLNKLGSQRSMSLFNYMNRTFAKRYYIVNYEYTENTYYTRSKLFMTFSSF